MVRNRETEKRIVSETNKATMSRQGKEGTFSRSGGIEQGAVGALVATATVSNNNMNTPKRGYQRTTNIKEIIERKGKQRGQRDTKTEEKTEEIALISPFRIFFFSYMYSTQTTLKNSQSVIQQIQSVNLSNSIPIDIYIFVYFLRFFLPRFKIPFFFSSPLFFLSFSSLLHFFLSLLPPHLYLFLLHFTLHPLLLFPCFLRIPSPSFLSSFHTCTFIQNPFILTLTPQHPLSLSLFHPQTYNCFLQIHISHPPAFYSTPLTPLRSTRSHINQLDISIAAESTFFISSLPSPLYSPVRNFPSCPYILLHCSTRRFFLSGTNLVIYIASSVPHCLPPCLRTLLPTIRPAHSHFDP